MLRGIYIRLPGYPSVMQPLPTAREKLVISRPCSSTAAPKARLPRLPVPDLAHTLERYVKSLEPFILEDESRGGTPFKEAYDLRSRWAEDFKNGVGQVCQERLKGLFIRSLFHEK
ncbi:hypothetical protein PHLCEN_2v3123 [Hermanssonia centrifuga]|uniref:Choline/carnitine acyltransferase domain-containing protein n=1 Tax=Hermanssonia centrifuga TaxID=98765 RepID=A0A2R6R3X7_9APHY|nr:hypothetical protein PHLCEN_2v3123 [Hermanssonia centrifuga]